MSRIAGRLDRLERKRPGRGVPRPGDEEPLTDEERNRRLEAIAQGAESGDGEALEIMEAMRGLYSAMAREHSDDPRALAALQRVDSVLETGRARQRASKPREVVVTKDAKT
jgi:hypothetical protein